MEEKYKTANWSFRQGFRSFFNFYFSFSLGRRFVFKLKYWAICFNIYIYIYFFVLFYSLFTSSSPCRKDQFAILYFSTSLILLIHVYNWEIWHHSLVCCCGFADILDILGVWAEVGFSFAYPILKKLHRFFVKTISSLNWVHRKGMYPTEYWNLSFFIPIRIYAATIRAEIVIRYNMMFTMVTAIPCAKWKKLRWVSR